MARVLIVLFALLCATSTSLAQVVVCDCRAPQVEPADDCCCEDEPAPEVAIAGLGCCNAHLRSAGALPPAVFEGVESPQLCDPPAAFSASGHDRALRPRSLPAPATPHPPPRSGADRRILLCSFLS